MSCPDDDVIAAFMQGALPPSDRSRVEDHLDVCPACTALLSGLGQVYGPAHPEAEAGSRELDRATSDAKTVVTLAVAMTILHGWAAVLAAPTFLRAVRALASGQTTVFDRLALAIGLLVYAALPLAGWTVRLLLTRSSGGFRAARVYAALATLSVFAAPLAAWSLYLLARPGVRARLTSGGAAR